MFNSDDPVQNWATGFLLQFLFPSQVYKVSWYMAQYGHGCPKRHKAFTNNRWAGKYNLGKFHLKKFRETQPENAKPTLRYKERLAKRGSKGFPV